jgi:ribosomal protein S18 acetylase RimI-like enzyme
MPTVTVRDFRRSDVDDLYEVCLRTGDAGQDASGLVSYPRLLGDIYVGPYLELAPEFALVAADGVRASGYALGVLDTASFERRLEKLWWPHVQATYLSASQDVMGEGFDGELLTLVRNPQLTRHPHFPEYPSHLHIDLLEHIRGRGVGSQMLATLFQRLRLAGSPGVHLGVDAANVGAQRFYRHLGFVELSRVGTDLFMGLSWQPSSAGS